MTTGYIVTGRGDLDTIFKARVSAAAANVNFKNSGGVDLSQLLEPRGAATPVSATGFLSAGVDLAQIFQDIAAISNTISIGNMRVEANVTSGSAIAQYQLRNDGQLWTTDNTNNVTFMGNWITPQTNMSLFSARVTMLNGALTGGTINSWLNLATTRIWSLQTGAGSAECDFRVEIRTDADGIVRDTADINMFAERS